MFALQAAGYRQQFVLEQRGAVIQAVKKLDAAGDIADSLIMELARAAGCERVVTFDKDAGRVGMELLKYIVQRRPGTLCCAIAFHLEKFTI